MLLEMGCDERRARNAVRLAGGRGAQAGLDMIMSGFLDTEEANRYVEESFCANSGVGEWDARTRLADFTKRYLTNAGYDFRAQESRKQNLAAALVGMMAAATSRRSSRGCSRSGLRRSSSQAITS
jgi:hypothetical protein